MIDEIVHPARTQAHASFLLATHHGLSASLYCIIPILGSLSRPSSLSSGASLWAGLGRHFTTMAPCFRDARPLSFSPVRKGPPPRPEASVPSLAARQPRGSADVSSRPLRPRSRSRSASVMRVKTGSGRLRHSHMPSHTPPRLEKRLARGSPRFAVLLHPATATSVWLLPSAPCARRYTGTRPASHSRVRQAHEHPPGFSPAVIRPPGSRRTRALLILIYARTTPIPHPPYICILHLLSYSPSSSCNSSPAPDHRLRRDAAVPPSGPRTGWAGGDSQFERARTHTTHFATHDLHHGDVAREDERPAAKAASPAMRGSKRLLWASRIRQSDTLGRPCRLPAHNRLLPYLCCTSCVAFCVSVVVRVVLLLVHTAIPRYAPMSVMPCMPRSSSNVIAFLDTFERVIREHSSVVAIRKWYVYGFDGEDTAAGPSAGVLDSN
ncbi:hypothetical protein PENSPDRAFT_469142 [Peniophora sp. CONT]|nr:hypothetical protein PENSPDRAFT_469142 [Peniophora sp. CONT]